MIPVLLPIFAAILCATSFGLTISLLMPALTLRMEALGYSGAAIGLHGAIAGVASLIIAPLTPWLVKRFGFARLLRMMLFFGGISIASIALSDDPIAWLLPRFGFSLCVTCIFALSESWINTITPQHQRGLMIGIYAATLSLGFAAGPAILASISAQSAWLVPIAVACLAPVLLAACIAPRDIGAMHSINVRALVAVFKRVPVPLAAALTFGIFETSAFTFMPLWGLANHISVADSTLLITMLNLGIVLFQLPLGLLAGRLPPRPLLAAVVGLIVVFSGVLAIYAAHMSIWVLYAVVLVWGGLAAALYTVGLVWLMALVAPSEIVQANSYFVWMYTIGMVLAPQLMGLMHDVAPQMGVMLGIGSVLLLYFIALIRKS